MFATFHSTQVPQFMSPIPELAVDALSHLWQGLSFFHVSCFGNFEPPRPGGYPSDSPLVAVLAMVLINLKFYHTGQICCFIRGGFRGAHQAQANLFLPVKKFLEPYICPYANTCLNISSCVDLECLLYVCATVNIQFANAILSHTHPPLGRYASSRIRAPY